MEKTRKKAIIFLIVMLLFTFRTMSFAEQEIVVNEKTENYKRWESLSEEERKNSIEPLYFDIDFNSSVKKSIYNNLIRSISAGNELETKYDPRENQEKTFIVKNQKQTESCWAFSFSSVLESVSKKKNQYSPMHIDYMTAKMFERKLGSGGNAFLGLAYSTSGNGPVYENELAFDTVYDEANSENNYLKDTNNVTLNQTAKGIVKDASVIGNIYKTKSETGELVYSSDSSGKNKYTSEEVSALRNLIKTKIKENGAISATMYIHDVTGYNQENKSFYCDNYSGQIPNHAVTIVGWDDNFSKTKFTPNAINDGAYIALNSYGTEYGDQGYFYISYDDAKIEEDLVTVDSLEEFDVDESGTPKCTYDNLYQYDELGMSQILKFNNGDTPMDTIYVANVFEKDSEIVANDEKELISKIGLYIGDTAGVRVYVTNVDDGMPSIENIGNPVVTRTGENALEAGYHTVELPSPMEITGNKFAIIAEYIKEGGVAVPFDCNLKESGYVEESVFWDKSTSNAGESFIYINNNWEDLKDLKVSETNTLKGTNACIKVFTTILEPDEVVPVTGVSLDNTTYSITEGEELTLVATITPTYATNKNVTWSSSNEEVATISETGIIKALKEGTTTITVKTVDGEFTATCILTVTKKVNSDDDIYKDDDDGEGEGEGENEGSKDQAQQKPSVDEDKSDSSNIKEIPGKSEQFKDSTTASTGLPYTGIKLMTIIMICSGIFVVIMYKKYKNLKEIK